MNFDKETHPDFPSENHPLFSAYSTSRRIRRDRL